jgi:hypothetical protein
MQCTICKGTAGEVINAGLKLRVGWYCPQCKHFLKAYLRERKYE